MPRGTFDIDLGLGELSRRDLDSLQKLASRSYHESPVSWSQVEQLVLSEVVRRDTAMLDRLGDCVRPDKTPLLHVDPRELGIHTDVRAFNSALKASKAFDAPAAEPTSEAASARALRGVMVKLCNCW